jgi:hypothetical protein
MNFGIKMREKILSGSEFQFKTWVFFNIRKILRFKGMVPAISQHILLFLLAMS